MGQGIRATTMTRNEILRRYPRASEAFIKANLYDGLASNSKRESDPPNEPVAKKERAGSDVGFCTVLLTSYRLRLLDEDNIWGKYMVDSIKNAGLIRDDSPAWCKIETIQIKVKQPEDERTEIVILEQI